MNGLNVLVLSLSRQPQRHIAGVFEEFGHEITDLADVPNDRETAGEAWDIVVVDAADARVDRNVISRIRSGFSRPVLVVGDRPMCLSGIDGAMFCFSDASAQGHELALRMCLALSPLISCERGPQAAELDVCDPLGSLLSPGRWLRRPAIEEAAPHRTISV